MVPVLSSLIALQDLDTAAEAVRRRLAELPAAEQAAARSVATAAAEVERVTALLAANQHSRRDLEKQVALVDTRLARFEDHKAAVKTNQEYTALLHEIATAKAEKDALEEQILGLMEGADAIGLELTTVKKQLATAERAAAAERAALTAERSAKDAELARLSADRAGKTIGIDALTLAKYEQLLKQRKMVAVARMDKEICTACHVRLRPAVTQTIRRNSEIVVCDSCQRILYFVPAPPPAPDPPAAGA